MEALIVLQPDSILAVTKTVNAHILAFIFADGAIDCKWVLRDNDLNVLKVKDVPYLEKMLLSVGLETQNDGKVKVVFSMPVAMDNRDLFLAKMPQGFKQKYGIVFDEPTKGPSYLKEVFVDIEASLSYCRCAVLSSGLEYVETVPVNLGPFKSFF
jgi:hypothetical protein